VEQNRSLWAAVKWGSVAFNSVATWDVFYHSLLLDVSKSVAIAGTVVAIGLIDLLFVALVNFLEQPKETDEAFGRRWAYVFGLVVLYLFIVAIGYESEGLLAIGPRIGLGIVTMVAILQFVVEWFSFLDETWELRFEKKRHRIEKRDRDRLLRFQRKVKQQEERKALTSMRPELQNEYTARFRDNLLNRTGNQSEPPIAILSAISKVNPMQMEKPKVISDLPEGVFKSGNGFGWTCPICDETKLTDTKGHPYQTARAALSARNRHKGSCNGGA